LLFTGCYTIGGRSLPSGWGESDAFAWGYTVPDLVPLPLLPKDTASDYCFSTHLGFGFSRSDLGRNGIRDYTVGPTIRYGENRNHDRWGMDACWRFRSVYAGFGLYAASVEYGAEDDATLGWYVNCGAYRGGGFLIYVASIGIEFRYVFGTDLDLTGSAAPGGVDGGQVLLLVQLLL
jgi:hypothetical protein